ncbi:hypothetical protein CFC21_022722, partial [Triticum aestivum]
LHVRSEPTHHRLSLHLLQEANEFM